MGNGIGYTRAQRNSEHNSLFRSEDMTLCQLFLQSEASYSVIAELGELGLIQFKDLNPDLTAFQRKYVAEVRMCDDMDRILRYIEGELRKDGLKPVDLANVPEAPQPKEIRLLLNELGKLESDLKEINSNRQTLRINFSELKELQITLNASQHFLEETASQGHSNPLGDDIEMGEKSADYNSMKLNFITGTIPAERLNGFERMLWFACRGNIYLRYSEIKDPFEDPVTGAVIRKAAFCLFFQGEQLKAKAKKICEGFKCNVYNIPKTPQERKEMTEGLAQRIKDMHEVLQKTDDHRHRLLLNASQDVRILSVKVLKAKAIYHVLNLFNVDVTQKCLIAECWCPTRDLERINQAIAAGTEKAQSEVQSVLNSLTPNETIPTFNRTNKFTKAFQNLVDAYGISRYKEINPALFSVITFPFIFAIMFGDFAHGLIMFGFALWMVLSERKYMGKKGGNEIWNIVFGGRYIVLLMGIFSVYTGFIYNDFFSKSVNSFKTGWVLPDTIHEGIPHAAFIQLTPNASTGLYPMGVDPIWMIGRNKITFINSYKMKMSIVIGIIQMLFGLSLSLVNHIYFKSWIGVFCQFIPEFIFIMSIFGYMIVLIVAKWITKFNNTSCAPSILVGFINMFLFSYTPREGCDEFILYKTQDQLQLTQTILVILAALCMPWLLIAKPLCIGIKRRMKTNFRHQVHVDSNETTTFTDVHQIVESNGNHGGENHSDKAGHHGGHNEDEEPFGEIIVHQCIHTIEYCLGCVSNTASYLRLWALSLAHAQLSEVLWNMVLKIGLSSNSNYGGAPITIAVFAPFAVLTVCILLLMEGLSAFLHALRLHWVEFNSKFFKGDGIKFAPFTFKNAINQQSSSE